jgi:murein L,D-transpeptidase YcbB/YkuD
MLCPLFCKMQQYIFLYQTSGSPDFGSQMVSKLEAKKRWIQHVFRSGYPSHIPLMKKQEQGIDSLKIRQMIEDALVHWEDLSTHEELSIGVKRFQHRNGMDTTGKIDNRLIALLNLSYEDWIQKLETNKARMIRTMVSDSNGLIWVNIPDFQLRWLNAGRLLHVYRVIVGQRDWPTYEFESKVNALHVHPSWYVPPGIWEKELRQIVEKNNSYLIRHHMVWESGRLRQVPGPWNALGKVKVVVPNRYLIFLHDTPNKSLFKKRKRMFSHGCIRVEHAEMMAQDIYKTAGLGNEIDFKKFLDQGIERIIPIQSNIPVVVGYWTLWVDEQNKLQNREDVYGWD